MEAREFEFLNELSADMQKAVADMGFQEPTPIQAEAIPLILKGKDIIGQAQTGTGKTAAFGIPVVQALDPEDKHTQALILCPTRELALQIAGEIKKLARYAKGLNVLAVYGGEPIDRQIRALRNGAQVVVGTPGRVMDHMRRGTVDFSELRMAILDEADEMLDMGFREDIETILRDTPSERQTVLFSATMPRTIMGLAKRYQVNPVHVEIARKEMTVERIAQAYIRVKSFHKNELLCRLLVRDSIKRGLVFCNTKREVEAVVTQLQTRGFTAAGLHGDMRQIERDAVVARYRKGTVSILVATDVAARGLDIEDIDAVINYDMPQDVEYYVHRIGRTGRAGKEGKAYTFVVGREVSRMWEYRKITGAKILCEEAPSAQALMEAQVERVQSDILEELGKQSDSVIREHAQEIINNVNDPAEALAAAIQLLLDSNTIRFNEEIDLKWTDAPRTMQSEPRRQGKNNSNLVEFKKRSYGNQKKRNDGYKNTSSQKRNSYGRKKQKY